MKINVAQIRRMEGETVKFTLIEDLPPLEWGTESVVFQGPVHVELQISNPGKLLLAEGRIKADLKVSCSRCLEDFIYPIDLSFDDEWVYASQATEEQRENAFLYDKDDIEIGERISEQIALALPMKFLCSEDCRGLCPVCGKNINLQPCDCTQNPVDPRLAKLTHWGLKE